MNIDPRDLTLTIEVESSDYETFLNRTWKIESIPYKFILPLEVALSTSNDGSLDFCLPLPYYGSTSCNLAFAPPPFGAESPELRVCSREDPCQHYGGDCASVGDDSCVDDLGTILSV